MSYARMLEKTPRGPSDVYVYASSLGWECCGCKLGKDFWNLYFTCDSRPRMIAHLLRHRKAGHVVPPRALKALRAELSATRRARRRR